jgi:hypothetical protein
MRNKQIVLSVSTPVAAGGHRAVYAHPHDPRFLIKIVLPKVAQRKTAFFSAGSRKYLLKEHREARRLGRLGYTADALARTHGLVATDIGEGIIAEAVRLADGTLAPTLFDVRDRLHEPALRAAIEDFAQWGVTTPVILSDLNPKNIVVTTEADSRMRLVLIDGYGSGTFLPVREWFSLLNRRANLKRVARMTLWVARQGIPQTPAAGAEERAVA